MKLAIAIMAVKIGFFGSNLVTNQESIVESNESTVTSSRYNSELGMHEIKAMDDFGDSYVFFAADECHDDYCSDVLITDKSVKVNDKLVSVTDGYGDVLSVRMK